MISNVSLKLLSNVTFFKMNPIGSSISNEHYGNFVYILLYVSFAYPSKIMTVQTQGLLLSLTVEIFLSTIMLAALVK